MVYLKVIIQISFSDYLFLFILLAAISFELFVTGI